MYRLSLRIDGDITFEAFRDALSNFLHVLQEVDMSISGRRSVRWTLADLRRTSPAVLTWVGAPRRRPRKKTEPQRDYAPLVGDGVIAGMEKLERGQGRPEGFSDEALDAALRLARVKARKGITSLAISGENSEPTREPRSLDLTERVAASVNDIIGPKYTTPGSVEGILQAINSHGELYFNIYDSIWGARVRCDIPPEHKQKALEAFDSRVIVTGIVGRDASGHPRHVKAETIEKLPDSATLPQSLLGIDPDYTGGLESAEYLKRRWSGDA